VSFGPGADHSGPIGPGEVDPESGTRPHSMHPRRPRTLGGAVYLAVLAVCATGLLVVVLGQWRAGMTLFGGAFVAAAIARWLIPDVNAGMLHLRRKAIDVPTLLLIGGALVTLATIIPERGL
jgi:Na+/H+ antiporter NhaC